MKKLILLAVATFFIFNAKAQEGFNAGVQLGYFLTGMVNGPATTTTTSYVNPYTHFDTKFAPKVGVSVGYGFVDAFGVLLELNFATLGQNATGTSGSADIKRSIDLSYIEIPLYLKVRTPGESAHYYFMAGPQFNFLTGATIKDDKTTITDDAKDHFNSTDLGLTFDTGLEIDIPKLFFNFGLRGYYGLTDPNATKFQLPSSAGDYKSSNNFAVGLNVAAHYKF